jgi:hypothetical protein
MQRQQRLQQRCYLYPIVCKFCITSQRTIVLWTIAFSLLYIYRTWNFETAIVISKAPPDHRPPPSLENDQIHIVFSTGCNAFQDCMYMY